jgi:hypothetical protein
MFVHSRILLTCRRHRVRVRFEKTVCTFWICANSVHTWYIPVYTMYIVQCRMFSHSPGQVSYFLAVGQCVDVGHASIHTPCTAQHILQPKVKKTCLQELDCVYSMRIMPYSMHIMLYTSIYHPLLCIRLEPSCEPVSARPHACAGLRL